MIKASFISIFIFLLITNTSFSQEHESILTAPEEWQSEIIPFPIGFAPDIDFTGFEDLRFAPGWNDINSEAFWTYTFVWYIDTYGAMSESKLTTYFQSYYDGLMKIEHKNLTDSQNQIDKAKIQFIKKGNGFFGTMKVFDNFFSKDYITLHIAVTEEFCPKLNKQIITCDISRQPFEHEVWKLFKQVTLKIDCN